MGKNSIKNIIKLMAGATAAVVMFSANPNAKADSLTYSGTVATQGTDWLNSINIAKFNAGFGTLTSVEIKLTSTGTTAITVSNSASATSNASGGVRTELQIFLSDPDKLLIGGNDNIPQIDATIPAGTTATSYNLAPGDSISFNPPARTLTSDNLYDSGSAPDVLSEFTGLGQIVLTGTTFTQTVINVTSGNASTSQSTSANLGVTVIYNYDAVPEPGTYALLGLGVGFGVVAYIRRRRAVRA